MRWSQLLRSAAGTATKPMSAMPRPPSVPLLGNLPFALRNSESMVEMTKKVHLLAGPIALFRAPGLEIVMLSDPDDFQKVMMNEGRNPSGSLEALEALKKALERMGWLDESLPFAKGETWRRLRLELQKRLLLPQDAEAYLLSVSDTLDKASAAIPAQGGSLDRFLPRLSFELTANMLFDTSLNILTKPDPEDEAFVQGVLETMVLQGKMMQSVPLWRLYDTADMKGIQANMQRLTERATFHFERAVKRLEENPESRAYVAHLVKTTKLTPKEIVVNTCVLLIAGVDTTSLAMYWLLYNLAAFPKAQERLHGELRAQLGGRNMQPGDMSRLPYLRSCLKEAPRLNPISSSLSRTLPVDLELKGYRIPAGTMVVMNFMPFCHNPEVFERPLEFIPERWDSAARERRKEAGNTLHDHPYAVLPFSVGPRMCIGARFAGNMLGATVARLVQDYHIGLSPRPEGPPRQIGTNLLRPASHVNFTFTRRREVPAP